MRDLPGGFHGKLLRVDLTRGRTSEESIPADWLAESLGGRGLATRLVLRDVPVDADPLGPGNVLVFTGGPMTGHAVGGAGRHAVHARSPLTGVLGESFAGGWFGTEMVRTGFDAFVVEGRAERPVYLEVVDGVAAIRDAADLWGRSVSEAEATLLERVPKGRVASIGVGGENLVRFAAVMNDRNRAAGRTGMGAVMGSKRLKAIVVRGRNEQPIADKAAFTEARKAYTRTIAAEHDGFGVLGTSGGVKWLSKHGILPTRNWREGRFAQAIRLDGRTMHDTILKKRDTCTSCPVMCKRVVEATFAGAAVAPEQGGPEYETLASFGSLAAIEDLNYVAAANAWSNEYGLDTISAGSVIAHAMEARERGIVPDAPEWGDAHAAFHLLHQIAKREGLGDELAEGVKRFAEKHGTEAFAMHVKGAELPMHEPRGKKGLGLSYACTFRGANHMDGLHDTNLERADAAPDIGVTERVSRFSVDDKARINKAYEDARSFTNSLVMCSFDVWEIGKDRNIESVVAMVAAATGLDLTVEDAFRIGERNFQLARLASVRFGATAADDDLPARLKEDALAFATREGGERLESVRPAELDRMKREYYALRGWDPETGAPTRDALAALGLDAYA